MRFTWVLLLILAPACLAVPVDYTLRRLWEYAQQYPNQFPNDPEYGADKEGDILVVDKELDETPDPLNAIPDRNKLWTDNTLYYTINEPTYDADQLAKIEAGIQDLVNSVKVNGKECVRILPRPWGERNYVEVSDRGGCSSYLGMIGGRQTMSLAPGCINRHGTIMHEFLHAFGFHHEQKRGDRDDYVYVNYDNIQPGTEHNFYKLEDGVTIDHLQTPYDYGSVLHYSAYAFAVDRNIPTIVPHDPNAEIGQRLIMSQLDIERVQILYGCIAAEDSKHFKHLAGKLNQGNGPMVPTLY